MKAKRPDFLAPIFATPARAIQSDPRHKPLMDWLDKKDGSRVWEAVAGRDRRIEGWVFPGGMTAVVVLCGSGWEIFTPSGTNRIDETLADASARLGLGGQ